MPLPDFDQLFATADRLAPRIPVAVAGAADQTVLAALSEASSRGWVTPILAGATAEIEQTAAAIGVSLGGMRIVDAEQPARAAVKEVREGRAQLLMKGQIATPDLMKGVLDSTNGLRTGRTMGQFVLMEVMHASGPRSFLLTDTGLCIQPTLDQKVDLLRQLIEVAHALGTPEPRIALMAASEKVVASMPETEEAAELQRRCEAGEFPGCLAQGPLSFDLAYATDAGEKKRLDGGVIGAADAMLFPNLLSANLTVKAIMYTANCRFGGVLRGAACPIVFMSLADSTETRLNSLALAIRLVSIPGDT